MSRHRIVGRPGLTPTSHTAAVLDFRSCRSLFICRSSPALLNEQHAPRITAQLAIDWACTSKRQSPITQANRIMRLRGFAKYCQKFDSATEIPPHRPVWANKASSSAPYFQQAGDH